MRWWLEKYWFRGESDGWCTDTTILLAQIVGKDHFKLFQGRVLDLVAPDGNSGHVYGLLDDYWIVDLTLDGFRTTSGERGPRIVAVPEWSPFVHKTYRYNSEASVKLTREVRRGRKSISMKGENFATLRVFCDYYRAIWRNSKLVSLPRAIQDKIKVRASRWAMRGFSALLGGKKERMFRAFKNAVELDPRTILPTTFNPSFRTILSRWGR